MRHHITARAAQQERNEQVLVQHASREPQPAGIEARGVDGRRQDLAGYDAPGLQLL